jgi:hypothetical protein
LRSGDTELGNADREQEALFNASRCGQYELAAKRMPHALMSGLNGDAMSQCR